MLFIIIFFFSNVGFGARNVEDRFYAVCEMVRVVCVVVVCVGGLEVSVEVRRREIP